jgi:hypothetical protein
MRGDTGMDKRHVDLLGLVEYNFFVIIEKENCILYLMAGMGVICNIFSRKMF